MTDLQKQTLQFFKDSGFKKTLQDFTDEFADGETIDDMMIEEAAEKLCEDGYMDSTFTDFCPVIKERAFLEMGWVNREIVGQAHDTLDKLDWTLATVCNGRPMPVLDENTGREYIIKSIGFDYMRMQPYFVVIPEDSGDYRTNAFNFQDDEE